jgi:hypothetical protein
LIYGTAGLVLHSARVREAKLCISRTPFAQRRREHRGEFVVVIVDSRSGFADVRACNASDVLDKAILEGDRGREEEGVKCRAVEALADE